MFHATKIWPYHVSCGGVVYREKDGGREYAVLYRGPEFGVSGNSWHLPKGSMDGNETLSLCALREIKEETGLESEIQGYLGATNRAVRHEEFDIFIDKTTHYFLTVKTGGDTANMDEEHGEVQWLSPEMARQKLSPGPKQEDRIISRAEDLLKLIAQGKYSLPPS
jgi:8-oxo-dGTP pyrophosphatase MutT (NUDIX family)